jgi:putative endonuclease
MNCGVYIMANESHSTLYVGMSSCLPDRVQSHKDGDIPGFTSKYRCTKLVYYEGCPDEDASYIREREIKGWRRQKKLALILTRNPEWKDLFEELIEDCT